jgi:hypothetical protein
LTVILRATAFVLEVLVIDLYAANVPIEAIMKMGRWRSNAALLYLRCQEVTPLKIAHAFRLSSEFGFEFWNAGPSVTRMGGNHR